MKKAIVGLVAVAAVLALRPAARHMKKMREHSQQMAAHCKQMAAQCKQMAAQSPDHGEAVKV
jgi:DNA-binding protein YbaB